MKRVNAEVIPQPGIYGILVGHVARIIDQNHLRTAGYFPIAATYRKLFIASTLAPAVP